MFCATCGAWTPTEIFNRVGCPARLRMPMCGADTDVGIVPGVGHSTPTPADVARLNTNFDRLKALRERQAVNSGIGRSRSIGAVSLCEESTGQNLLNSCSNEIISYDLDDLDHGGFGIAAVGGTASSAGVTDSTPTAVASSLGVVVPATRVTEQSSLLSVPVAPATRVRLALPPSTAPPAPAT